CRKNLVIGSFSRPAATLFVVNAPTTEASWDAPLYATASLMNSQAPSLFPAFLGITQLWNELAAVRPGFGPDCGRRAMPRFLPSAFSKSLITNGNISTIAALPGEKYVFAL